MTGKAKRQPVGRLERIEQSLAFHGLNAIETVAAETGEPTDAVLERVAYLQGLAKEDGFIEEEAAS